MTKRAIYTMEAYNNGVHRQTLRRDTPLDGICHGDGLPSDMDNGAPTFQRIPVHKTFVGQDQEPGNAYNVLFSPQRIAERKCDNNKSYRDTEVPIVNKDAMGWIEKVVMEKNVNDISRSKVLISPEQRTVTTTPRTPKLCVTRDDDVIIPTKPPLNIFSDTEGEEEYDENTEDE